MMGTKGSSGIFTPTIHINFKYAKYFNLRNAIKHLKRHHTLLGLKKTEIKKYVRNAFDFANLIDPENHLSFVDSRGYTTKYSRKTGEVVIISKEGNIVTYFKPRNSKLDVYFNNLIKRKREDGTLLEKIEDVLALERYDWGDRK